MLESEKSKDVLNSSDEADLRKESEADAPEYAESDSGSVEFSNTESESCASKSGDEGAASEGQNLEGAQEPPLSSLGVLGRLPKKRNTIFAAILIVVVVVALFAVLSATHVICFHEWSEPTCTHPSVCSVCGKTQGDALEHEWQEATCTAPQTCSLCGTTKGKELGHDVKEWSIAAEPSCTEKGREVGECARCGSAVEKAIPVIDHTPGDWVVVTEPSVGQDGKAVSGLRSYSCTVCGKELGSESIELSAEEIESYFKEGCSALTYEQVARDSDAYKGEKATFTGEVIQVMQEGDTYTLRVNVTPTSYGYKDAILVLYTAKAGDQRILEDDVVTLYGAMAGMYTYETVMGAELTVPLMSAQYVEY